MAQASAMAQSAMWRAQRAGSTRQTMPESISSRMERAGMFTAKFISDPPCPFSSECG